MTGEAFNDGIGERHWDFAYDTRSELTGGDRRLGTALGSGTFMTPGNYDYTYDPIGNRTNSNVDGASPEMTYTRNNVNQYTATADPSEQFGYDGDGNLTADGTYKYTWDAENRLIEIVTRRTGDPEAGDRKLEFKYDYKSRRVEKKYSVHDGDDWVPQSTQRFVYDEWNVVLVLDGGNALKRKYTWGLDLSGLQGAAGFSPRGLAAEAGIHGAGGIGGLLAAEEPQTTGGPKRYWYFYDGNGNVGQFFDATDPDSITAAGRYQYDPYGNLILSGGPDAAANPFRFSTKWLDTELAGETITGAVGTTGLYYYGYRYYSPRLGRWISRDPMGEKGGQNLYGYVRNRSLNSFDALGLCPPCFPGSREIWDGPYCICVEDDPVYPGPYPGDPFSSLGMCECASEIRDDVMEEWAGKAPDDYLHCVASCRVANSCGAGFIVVIGGFARECKGEYCHPEKNDFWEDNADNLIGYITSLVCERWNDGDGRESCCEERCRGDD